jgi:seryl-tRNA synthetase
MLDIQIIRDNTKEIKAATKAKGFDPKIIDEVLAIDIKRRKLIASVESLRAARNKFTKKDIAKGKKLKVEIRKAEDKLGGVIAEYTELMLKVPNPSAKDVKVGTPEENEIIRKVGKPKKFTFPVKDHVEIGKITDTIDIERGTKISQSGFYLMKNEAALLEFGLIQYAMNKLAKKGFAPVITPNAVKERNMVGCGFQARSEKERQIYHLEGEDLDLIATAEITLVGMYTDETLDAKTLPRKHVGYSYCYRYEKGSYGKDVRGIMRVHEFRKVEMVGHCLPEDSDKLHKDFLGIEEEIWKELKIPYQVVKMATGDLGNAATRKFDIEAWMPSQNKYREVTSTSNTTDFQARRLNIKVKRENGKTEILHTLNGTVVALGRTIIAIYENYQQKDGSVKIPEVLQKWVGRDTITVK